MRLPDSVSQCLQALEGADYPCYCVGGCVRDAVLGLIPHDYDLCSAATPAQMKAVFAHRQLVLAGEKHGTVGVVTDEGIVEITTFRTESGYEDNRHPDRVEFVTDITQDLARRDFTVNAMAWSPLRGFADPYGGRADLERGILRAVGNPATRFQEDSLRILRGVRFAVRYHLSPDPETEKAMGEQAFLMDNLARERVFEELCKLLPLVNAGDLLRFAPILAQVIPELAPTQGFDQHSRHHAYDVFTHTAYVMEAVPAELPLRWAALLHDIGKVPTFTRDAAGQGHFLGHAGIGAAMADTVLRRLKAPTALREQVVLLIELHMTKIEPEKKVIRRWLSRLGEETLRMLLLLQQADMAGKSPEYGESSHFSRVLALIDEITVENACLTVRDLAVNGHDLMAQGLTGKDIGTTLNALLALVLDEKVENEKSALLAAIQHR